MADQQVTPIKLGDRVRILGPGGMKGRVIELRGPLGPKGAEVYRVLLRRKPRPAYISVLADQLEVIPAEGQGFGDVRQATPPDVDVGGSRPGP